MYHLHWDSLHVLLVQCSLGEENGHHFSYDPSRNTCTLGTSGCGSPCLHSPTINLHLLPPYKRLHPYLRLNLL